MNQEVVTIDQLRDIFYSGYPATTSWDLIDQLYIAIHTDEIVYSKSVLCSVEHYHTLIDKAKQSEGLGPQSKGHMALKDVAQQFILNHLGQSAYLEYYFAGLHPDALSYDYNYVIECGTTDPSCVIIYLTQPDVKWIGNIPYPVEEESEIMLHSFSRGVRFTEMIQQNVSRLRDAFLKRR